MHILVSTLAINQNTIENVQKSKILHECEIGSKQITLLMNIHHPVQQCLSDTEKILDGNS